MFDAGNFGKEVENLTDKFLEVKGDLTEEEATAMVAELLIAKPMLLYRLMTGEVLFPFQAVKIGILRARDFTSDISARGGAKSFTTAVFALIYAICNPGVKILVLGPTMRQAKVLLTYIMDIVKKPDAHMLRQFLTEKNYKRDPDRYSIKIGGLGLEGVESEIFAMALGDGKKIRGARAQVIILDEAFAIPQNIIEEVIGPMMVVNADVTDRIRNESLEDRQIAAGIMKESERKKFKNNKMIMLSSACYEFEPLYKRFCTYREKILDPKYPDSEEAKNSDITYGIVNMSWEAFPRALLSKSFILREQESMSEDSFRREYQAQFSPDSAAYFKMSVMSKQTIPIGEYPHIEIIGDDKSKYFYVMGIDPNFSNTDISDNYAISLLKVDRNHLNKGTLVHNYAVAGLDMDSNIRYMLYLLTHFNIEYIIMDNAGANQSLETWNNSSLFKERNMHLDFFVSPDTEADFKLDKDGKESKGIRAAKAAYDLASNKIVHKQAFHTNWIREANEYLQMCFDRNKLSFASRPIESNWEHLVKKVKIPIEEINFKYGQKSEFKKKSDALKNKQLEFVDHQADLIDKTKTECASIKIVTSPQGNQTFDLPKAMKNRTDVGKPRKDSYSALLLANYGRDCYEILHNTPEEEENPYGGSMPVSF